MFGMSPNSMQRDVPSPARGVRKDGGIGGYAPSMIWKSDRQREVFTQLGDEKGNNIPCCDFGDANLTSPCPFHRIVNN
jgi:hypothetical protein